MQLAGREGEITRESMTKCKKYWVFNHSPHDKKDKLNEKLLKNDHHSRGLNFILSYSCYYS